MNIYSNKTYLGKKVILLILSCLTSFSYGQFKSKRDKNIQQTVINTQDSLTQFNVLTSDKKLKNIQLDKTYAWYSNHYIHYNTGAYSGHLLHGKYEVFDIDENLMSQGTFDEGTRDGLWKYYQPGGQLIRTEIWDEGELVELTVYNTHGAIIKTQAFEKKLKQNKVSDTKAKHVGQEKEKMQKEKRSLSKLFVKEEKEVQQPHGKENRKDNKIIDQDKKKGQKRIKDKNNPSKSENNKSSFCKTMRNKIKTRPTKKKNERESPQK